ncbi:DUF2459 domain-containing protein [Sediminicoccus sp. KRV36]|uniref:DUF2459 domain-containing protein n=1 Tax=Sediminicoccus sp. KRV36 TaxID=3133721 RepID=UPI00200DE934|nr:DUF2459 domain-containing protein [Sediminicoccus rosea]UPY37080.1 DUF2459 domain-containing protein [Sediminicoccus rosea]
MRSWTASPELGRRGMLLGGLALGGHVALAGCATLPEAAACGPAPAGQRLWLLDAGWHTEIGLPPAALPASLAAIFPDAPLVFFGFGKRDFMLAEARGPAEWLAGPFPGEGAMQVTAWPGPPAGALGLAVSSQGLALLGAALAASFAPGPALPSLALIEARAGRRFYIAARGYSLAYTCNSWTAGMLAAAGLNVSAAGVVLARGVTAQAAGLAQACRATARAPVS